MHGVAGRGIPTKSRAGGGGSVSRPVCTNLVRVYVTQPIVLMRPANSSAAVACCFADVQHSQQALPAPAL